MRNRHQKEGHSAPELKLNIDYHWQTEPGPNRQFSEQEILALIQEVAAELGVTPEQASKIFIRLDDHFAVRMGRKASHLTTAFCLGSLNFFGRFKRCDVVLNRSRELFYSLHPDFSSADADPAGPVADQPSGPIQAELLTVRELLTWTIVEEINHAQFYLAARSVKRLTKWMQKYSQYLVDRGQAPDGTYNFDLVEVTAARHVLRIMEKQMIKAGRLHRARYFRKLYEASLRERRAVIPLISPELVDLAYVPTGFKEPASTTR